ncbi:MAG: GGDEF domain-containing protein [Desulfobulbaceae bacterium]|nr:GGDEF domain-containing protein [Desulfobulbaceae bacterium]
MSTPGIHEHLTTGGYAAPVYHLNRNRRALQFFLFAVAVDVLLILVELAAGISPLEDIRQNPWLYGYVFFITIASFSFFGAMIGWREDQLEALALRDSLTGLFNSRYLWARMDEQWATGKRETGASSLVLFDLDHFKRVNDSYGHPVGDELLKHIGRILQNAARKGDTVSRIGGEEFVLFLPNTEETDAAAIAERIRHTISRTTMITHRKQPIKITVSAGVAGTRKYTAITPQMLYAQADKALYLAKAQGRNRVITSTISNRESYNTLDTKA